MPTLRDELHGTFLEARRTQPRLMVAIAHVPNPSPGRVDELDRHVYGLLEPRPKENGRCTDFVTISESADAWEMLFVHDLDAIASTLANPKLGYILHDPVALRAGSWCHPKYSRDHLCLSGLEVIDDERHELTRLSKQAVDILDVNAKPYFLDELSNPAFGWVTHVVRESKRTEAEFNGCGVALLESDLWTASAKVVESTTNDLEKTVEDLTTGEIGKLAGVSGQSVREWIKNKSLAAYKIPRKKKYSVALEDILPLAKTAMSRERIIARIQNVSK